MFELKLKLHKILINKKLSRSQEKVSSQVIDSNPFSVFLSAASKLLVLCFFGVVILFPFFLMISISFMTDDEAQGLSNNFRILSDFETGSTYYSGEGLDVRPWADVVQNTYARALTSGYWKSVGITSLNVIVSVILKVLLTFLMGYAFSLRSWKGKGFVWFVALSLLVLPEVALLSGQYTVVIRTGLRANLFTIVLAISLPFVSSIFNTVMYKNAFEAIPGRIKEVSLVDGAGGFKYLFKVAFPMVVPTTLTIVILTALASWNSYLWPSLILGSRSEYELISTWLFKAGLNPDDPDSNQAVFTNIKMAAAMAVIAPLFIFYLIFRKRIMGAISRQGSTIKG